jgi:dihydropteroate synthase
MRIRILDIRNPEQAIEELSRFNANKAHLNADAWRNMVFLNFKIEGISSELAKFISSQDDSITATSISPDGISDMIISIRLDRITQLRTMLENFSSEGKKLASMIYKVMDNFYKIRTAYKFGNVEFDFSKRTYIMGILNVTPDSFSDGGKYFSKERAIDRAIQMIDEGADIIDVGGESTRPGSEPVPLEEELRRVIPVISEISKRTKIPISIDTYKSEVARQALDNGAVIVNDISGLRFDKRMVDVVSEYNSGIVIMHIKGRPKTMQINPEYNDVISEIYSYLSDSVQIAKSRGIEKIIIDPGIGFGKRQVDNLEIIRRLREFKSLGYPILIGVSRKSFIGNILNLPVEERLEGTLAAVAISIWNGANIVRVHDVKEIKRVVKIIDAIKEIPIKLEENP